MKDWNKLTSLYDRDINDGKKFIYSERLWILNENRILGLLKWRPITDFKEMLENKTVNLKDWNKLTSLYDRDISEGKKVYLVRAIEISIRTEFFVIYNEDRSLTRKSHLEIKLLFWKIETNSLAYMNGTSAMTKNFIWSEALKFEW